MDRGAWQATVYRVARVGHDLATKLLLLGSSAHEILSGLPCLAGYNPRGHKE